MFISYDGFIFCSLAGAGLQLSAEEGFPERSDALWDAAPRCLHHTVAGSRPEREIGEGVQVREAATPTQ